MAEDTTPVDDVAAGVLSAARISKDDVAEDAALADVVKTLAEAEVARATAETHPGFGGPVIRIPVLGGDDELYMYHATEGRKKILRHGKNRDGREWYEYEI